MYENIIRNNFQRILKSLWKTAEITFRRNIIRNHIFLEIYICSQKCYLRSAFWLKILQVLSITWNITK